MGRDEGSLDLSLEGDGKEVLLILMDQKKTQQALAIICTLYDIIFREEEV